MRKVFFWFFVVCFAGSTFAAEPGEFEIGNQLFDQGKFAEAKERFQHLVESKNFSANLFYNLGNTEFRLGNFGLAALNFERALALEPAHPEAKANLEFVRGQTGARLMRGNWMEVVLPQTPINIVAIAGAIAAWVLLFGIFVRLTGSTRFRFGILITSSLIALLYCGVTIYRWEERRGDGVVIGSQVVARLAPAENSAVADTLPPGSQVRILAERGQWTYCMLPGQGRGWVPSGSVQCVRISS
jgi:hypothetical protein